MRVTPAPGLTVYIPGTDEQIPPDGIIIDPTDREWQFLLKTGDVLSAAGDAPAAAALTGYLAWAILPENAGKTIFDWVAEVVIAASQAHAIAYVDNHGLGATDVQSAIDFLVQRAGSAPDAVVGALDGSNPDNLALFGH